MFIEPTDPAIRAYHDDLNAARAQGAEHEGNVRQAFGNLLAKTARARDLTLVAEHSDHANGRGIRYDGVLRDQYRLPHGYWEAKDSADDLTAEIRRKTERGYSLKNTIFEDTRTAVLFQNGREELRADLTDPAQIAALLTRFYHFDMPPFRDLDEAIRHFAGEIPHMAQALNERVQTAHANNRKFQAAFAAFYELCKTALNPNLREEAVDEMLIQHMLTERLMTRVFRADQFTRRNVIAGEIEKVIDALTSRHFNYRQFLGALDRFYDAIERAADELGTFSEKQAFLDNMYERFFQGYAVKVADTHGIVYTPQPIVDFMSAAVEEVLRGEFGLALGDPGVTIIDPCTGTGNFVVNLLRRVPPQNLKRAYHEQLFANEVMLLPYYVASLNIEHAYYELTGEYEAFEGICFVDTLDLAEGPQMKLAFMTEANAERVERQKATEMMVIIGNPPYNVGQLNENDNNKNRKYDEIDRRVRETYARDSAAANKNALYDPYVKFFRWATDRLGERDGVICFVSNNSFVDQIAFDGMRKHLLHDFTRVYHLDLHGNVRQNPKLSGTTHNVFGIQVGVGVTVAIRSSRHKERRLLYHRVPEMWTKAEKLAFLDENVLADGRQNALNTIAWTEITPDDRHTWLIPENADTFASYLPMGTKEAKQLKTNDPQVIFQTFSGGLKTNRDDDIYNFNRQQLESNVRALIENYNNEVDRYKRAGKPGDIDNFVRYDSVKWDSTLKRHLAAGRNVEPFDETKVRSGCYRPFSKRFFYFDRLLINSVHLQHHFLPTPLTELENRMIAVAGVGDRKGFGAFITDLVPSVDLAFEKAQCFPFYVYDEDGTNRRENITDWALAQFRTHYGDDSIGKWDIFYYVYGLLHHPGYRERYADSLKRELPRIPFAPDFRAFAGAGLTLAELHLYYDSDENVPPYPLDYVWAEGKRPSWRVEKMRLSRDKTALVVNDTLTLAGIPPETFDYRLGNRSALEWVVDQYRVKTDKRSGITSDPNRADDEQYIVNLVRRVVTVSVETAGVVAGLGAWG